MLCYSMSSANLREILLIVIQGETGGGEDVGFSFLFSFPMCGLSYMAERNLLAQIIFSSYFLLLLLKAQLSVAWEWTFPGWMWNVEVWQEIELYSLLLVHLFVNIER